jgi:hypothetical protein
MPIIPERGLSGINRRQWLRGVARWLIAVTIGGVVAVVAGGATTVVGGRRSPGVAPERRLRRVARRIVVVASGLVAVAR